MASKQIKLDYDSYHNIVNHQKVKLTEVLLSTFQVTIHQLTKHEDNTYDSTETLCRQLLKDFPIIKGIPGYTNELKLAHRLYIQLINEAPLRQNRRSCSPRNQAVFEDNFSYLPFQEGRTYASHLLLCLSSHSSNKENCENRVNFDQIRLSSATKILCFPVASIQYQDPKLTDNVLFSVLNLKTFYKT